MNNINKLYNKKIKQLIYIFVNFFFFFFFFFIFSFFGVLMKIAEEKEKKKKKYIKTKPVLYMETSTVGSYWNALTAPSNDGIMNY